MKAFPFVLPIFLLLGACASDAPKTVSDASREEAIRLYDGGIAEADWLSRLQVAKNTNSVKLADGFIFYETEQRGDAAWVTNIVLPIDAPENLKNLARSLRKTAEAPKELYLNGDTLWLDGSVVSEEQLLAEAKRLANFPRSRRPLCKLSIGKNVPSDLKSRVIGILKKSGIVIEAGNDK